jgi:hypothetical protein
MITKQKNHCNNESSKHMLQTKKIRVACGKLASYIEEIKKVFVISRHISLFQILPYIYKYNILVPMCHQNKLSCVPRRNSTKIYW